VFWVISVYFNIRNTLPKSGTFLLGHPVYICKLFCLVSIILSFRLELLTESEANNIAILAKLFTAP
jgi:hypothetical protein